MRLIRMRRCISFVLSLCIMLGMLSLRLPFAEAAADYRWNIADKDFIGGVFSVDAYSAAEGEITLTVDGAVVEGGEVSQSGGYAKRSFSLDTAKYPDGAKQIVLLVNAVAVLEKTVYFDNTAPKIPSWEAIDANGKKYTAYDMTVWPDDILILNTDVGFTIDFSPDDGEGSGVASVTAKLDNVAIPVPYNVEYDFISIGFHTISYVLTDNVGNVYGTTYRFEVRKPEPAYQDQKVTQTDSGYKLSAKLVGGFTKYNADFFLAEILEAQGWENVTYGDISAPINEGERPFAGKIDGAFITAAANGQEVYQTFDVDVTSKVGMLYCDYSGEFPKGSVAELSVYSYADSEWQVISSKTAFNGSVSLNFGKKGITIADYADDGIIRVRVRVISDSAEKYIKTLSFIPSIRYNSQIGETQTGTKGSYATVVYSGRVTSSLGWYIKAESEYFYSYSPTKSFELPSSLTTELKQFNINFGGNEYSRISFTWQTAEDMGTRVQLVPYGDITPDFSYAKTYTGTCQYSEETGNYTHKIRVTGLEAGEKYWFRYGDSASGIWSEPSLLEMPTENTAFSFLAASPSSDTAGADNWDAAAWKSGAEFLLTTGNEASDEAGWDSYFHENRKMFSTMMTVPTVGGESSGVWWTKYYISEQSGSGHENGVYYSFTYKNALFTVLNTNDVNSEGKLNSRQLAWLKKTLSSEECDWKFVSLNAPMNSEEYSALREQLAPIFEEKGVDIVFSSGGYTLDGYLGEETVTYGEKAYYSESDTLYICLPSMSEECAVISVNGNYLEFFCGEDQIKLFSSSRLEWIADRISKLPSVEDITVEYFDELTELRTLYDAVESYLAEEYIPNVALLVAAEERMEELLAITPPEIKVRWNLPERVLSGTSLLLPAATATDLTDGNVEVTVAVFAPDGQEVSVDEMTVIPQEYGIHTVVYTSVDNDGNTSSKEYSFLVKEYTPLDADEDGRITVADALKALRFSAKLLEPDSVDIAICDADADEIITVADALYILTYSLKNRSV